MYVLFSYILRCVHRVAFEFIFIDEPIGIECARSPRYPSIYPLIRLMIIISNQFVSVRFFFFIAANIDYKQSHTHYTFIKLSIYLGFDFIECSFINRKPLKCYHTFRFLFSVDLEALIETVLDKTFSIRHEYSIVII